MSDEEELPLHEMASSVGLSTSSPFFVASGLDSAGDALIELGLETPNWKGVSAILLGV